LYNKIYKSDQVSVGIPFQISVPLSFQTVKMVYKAQDELDNYETENDLKERVEESMEYKEDTTEDIIRKAEEEAEEIIRNADVEAQRILKAAEEEAFERVQSIENEAMKKGFENGYEEAKRIYEDLLQEAEGIKKNAIKEYNEVMAGIEKDAVEMVLEIARKVIGQEINLNKESILEQVKQALEKCSNREDITIKVSAQDYDFLVDNREKLLSMIDGIENLEIKKDPALKTGDCLVETSFGSIDAGIQTKLKKVEEAFMKVIGKE
jgi:flagellar assembly protein FliH